MRAAWGYDQPEAELSPTLKARIISMPGLGHREGPSTFRKAQAHDNFLSKVDQAEQRDMQTLANIAMQKMRAVAVDKMLDMTDALDAAVGSGFDKNLGTMDRQRFTATMGVLFTGSLSLDDLKLFCIMYGEDGPDPYNPELPLKVNWKQFALDFDEVEPADHREPNPSGEMMQHLMELRADAVQQRIDMSDAFEEFTGSLKERNSGQMAKNRFRATMGQLFHGNLSPAVLDEICHEYGAGDPDPREGGHMRVHAPATAPPAAAAPCHRAHPRPLRFPPPAARSASTCHRRLSSTGALIRRRPPLQVRWKQFAHDFDKVPPLPPPAMPDPGPEILGYMQKMNEYCNYHAIDLENDIEEYLGGKDACNSDLMPTGKFERALGVLLGKASNSYPHDPVMLDLSTPRHPCNRM